MDAEDSKMAASSQDNIDFDANAEPNADKYKSENIDIKLEEEWTNDIDLDKITLDSVKFTDQENAMFTFLMDVLNENKLDTTIRVSGGWVRDKLYGKESDDIDIALDNISGKDFEQLISKKLYEIDVKEGKINPDDAKSKEKLEGYSAIKNTSE